VDIISMVKHAAKEQEPILTAEERVDKAMKKVTTGEKFNDEQKKWLGFIREHLIKNLTIDMDDLKYMPIFEQRGGLGEAQKVFDKELAAFLAEINAAVAA